jgi:hypothetical protein
MVKTLLVMDPAQERATRTETRIPAQCPNADLMAATATASLELIVSQGSKM